MAALVMFSAALLLGLLLPSSMADDRVLYGGNYLLTDKFLSDGNNEFIMQSDCNLALYHNGREVWSSNTTGLGNNCFARMQTNGNLVIFNDNNEVVWSSNTGGEEDRYILFVHPLGHVIIYEPMWTSPKNNANNYKGVVIVKRGHSDTSITAEDNNILYAGSKLHTDKSLTEENYTLLMQSDCTLVLYDNNNNQILWVSPSNGLGHNCSADLQTDGNLLIRNDAGDVVWSTNTANKEDRYILFVHHEGHVIIYKPRWTVPAPININHSKNRKIAMVTKN